MSDSQSGWVGDLARAVLGGATDILDQASRALPRCQVGSCSEPAIVPVQCLRCGMYACSTHAWYHRSASVLCTPCFDELAGREQKDQALTAASVLGLADDEADPARAADRFRRLAAKVLHPDKAGQNPAAAHLWSLVQRCVEEVSR